MKSQESSSTKYRKLSSVHNPGANDNNDDDDNVVVSHARVAEVDKESILI